MFYGNVSDGRFTEVGVPNIKYPEDGHEFWLCSRPKNDPYITRLGLANRQFNVSGPYNSISKKYDSAQIEFFMDKDRFDLGNNMVQLAWGIFPDSESSDMSLVRGP